MKKTIMLTAVLVFAVAPMAQAQWSTGFEPPTYTAGFENLVPQDGWATQFGGEWHVQNYDGSGTGIPWIPQSTGLLTAYYPPVNPNGGDQYIGKSAATSGGGGRAWHAAPQAGLVQVRVDYCNGPEMDYPNYQGSIVSRGNWSGSGPGNSAGIYICQASTYVEPVQPPDPEPRIPRAGNWAYNVMAWDAAGTQFTGALAPFYRFDGVAGFDDLPRETWWRMGYTYDSASRRITEFYSKNIMTGEEWIMANPQGMMDYGNGPELADMYIAGGAAGTDILDAVGVYNVGNGSISMWDNIDVSIVPEPATMSLLALGGLALIRRRRRS